jgi:hypothetical protein
MDITRFDAITRTLAERKTRRSTIAGVPGIAGVGLLGADNAGNVSPRHEPARSHPRVRTFQNL